MSRHNNEPNEVFVKPFSLKYVLVLVLLLPMFGVTTVGQTAYNGEKKAMEKHCEAAKHYKFRITFTDKKNCGFSVNKPQTFLSEKSIQRRKKYGLRVDSFDLPITPSYVKAVKRLGFRVCSQSKWNNALVAEVAADSSAINKAAALPFVKEVRCVWIEPTAVIDTSAVETIVMDTVIADSVFLTAPQKQNGNGRDSVLTNYYGYAADQVRMLHADFLHNKGYCGNGMVIAMIDGGYANANALKGIDVSHLLGTRNYVRPGKSVYEELDHGMMALSCIAANEPHRLVGTAPEASFYLLLTEDGESEQLVEEDYWAAAIEQADSLGCDVVTSSLGYTGFDHSEMGHTYAELDGKTALISRSAAMAESRGLMVLCSAGNSGFDSWKKIGVPADAPNIITVGAVNNKKVNAIFSSVGNSADNRVKPDLMAMGENNAVYDTTGQITWADGTSFSCPTLCGAVTCLMQAFPTRRPAHIIRALQQTADNAEHPNNIFGYGIPNMERAFVWLQTH